MKDIALKTFENTGINITQYATRNLGAAIDSIEYRENHVTKKVNTWLDELNMICDIARIEPQAAYSCFVSGYKNKLTYIMRTIQNTMVWVSQYFQSLQVLNFKTNKSCQKIYETKLLSKNEQAVNNTTKKLRRIRVIYEKVSKPSLNFAKTPK